MGSFFSQCSITGLNIPERAEMVRLLILPKHSPELLRRVYSDRDLNPDKGLKVSNDVPWGDYVPFGFPLRGEYADYGQIRNVKEDENTKKLEEYFGIELELILEAVEDDSWISVLESDDEYYKKKRPNSPYLKANNLEELKLLHFSDMRADVYDRLVEMADELAEDYWWSFDLTYEEWLDYYGRLSSIREDTEREVRKTFGDKLNIEDEKELEDHLNDLIEMKQRFQQVRGFVPSYSKNFVRDLEYGSEFSDEYKEYAKFSMSMTRLNKWITPSNYGTQEQNLFEFLKLYEPILENVKEEHKKWEEEWKD